MLEADWVEFADCLYKPEMPRLVEVREVAAKLLTSVARGRGGRSQRDRSLVKLSAPVLDELWEALCTRFDREDLYGTDDRRWFTPYIPLRWMGRDDVARTRGPEGAPRALGARPLNAETMVAMISLDRGVSTAVEATALEAARRMLPWGAPPVRRVVWSLEDGSLPVQDLGASVFAWPVVAAQVRLPTRADLRAGVHTGLRTEILRTPQALVAFRDLVAFERAYYGLDPGPSEPLSAADGEARAWCRWRIVSALGDAVPPPPGLDSSSREALTYPGSVTGVRFRDLPDAIDASLRVWKLGCELLDVRGDAVIVRVPANFSPITAGSFDEVRRASVQEHRAAIVDTRHPRMHVAQPSL